MILTILFSLFLIVLIIVLVMIVHHDDKSKNESYYLPLGQLGYQRKPGLVDEDTDFNVRHTSTQHKYSDSDYSRIRKRTESGQYEL